MTAANSPPRREGSGLGRTCEDGMDECGMGVMCLMRPGRPCVLTTMTMLVVMRVLLVVRDGVEFGAGRGGRCGNYTVRESTYARLRSRSIWYICTVCTAQYFLCTYSTVQCRGKMANPTSSPCPRVAGACRESNSLVDGDSGGGGGGGGRVWIGMGAGR